MALVNQTQARKKVLGLAPGPVAVVLNEDDVDLAPTVSHHQGQGFAAVIVAKTGAIPDCGADLIVETQPAATLHDVINALMPALDGRWVFACYNGEYLFYPFSDSRSIHDVTQFVSEERRSAVHCMTVDLYSDMAGFAQSGSEVGGLHFDRMGYFALDRYDGPQKLDRQVDLFGGLKWRFSEHIPWERQRIDRISLFKAREGLQLGAENLLNDPESNTLNCAWHHSLTCAVASLRVAKSLLRNPGSTHEIDRFLWDQSEPFAWNAQQLMDVGLIEPGQWF